jgi:hypothetical protein
MQQELQAKLLVLKAFYLGRSAESSSVQNECYELVSKALALLLRDPDTSEEMIRRRFFYTLVLAELDRLNDPVPWRRAARQLGLLLLEEGAVDPFPYYLEVVRATTGLRSTGDFGDVHRAAQPKIKLSTEVEKTGRFGAYTEVYDFAADALGIKPETRKKFADFFHKTPLVEMLKKHGLAEKVM